ncbi:hypothetical protein D3C84_482930 [compost metagenome]
MHSAITLELRVHQLLRKQVFWSVSKESSSARVVHAGLFSGAASNDVMGFRKFIYLTGAYKYIRFGLTPVGHDRQKSAKSRRR